MTEPSVVADFELPATGHPRFSLFKTGVGPPFPRSDFVDGKSGPAPVFIMGFPFALISDPEERARPLRDVLGDMRSARL
jgi:hypothetical protein